MSKDTLTRGFAAIDALTAEGRKVTVVEVARRSGVHRSTIHRHPALIDAIAATRPTPTAPDRRTKSTDQDSAATIGALRDQLAGLTATVDRMAQVIQALSLDNDRLRQQIPDGVVVPMPRHP